MTVILVTLFFIIMVLVELAREGSKHGLPHDRIPKVAGQKR
jgi:preprotein translocase subunit SecG